MLKHGNYAMKITAIKRCGFLLGAVAAGLLLGSLSGSAMAEESAALGLLRVHPDNPRYFTDGSGKAVYLTGSHTWMNLQNVVDIKCKAEIISLPAFDNEAFLSFLEQYNHNFFRLWAWEATPWVMPDSCAARFDLLPFARTGPGTAHDGGLKFDPTKLNQEYFDRMRQRVVVAGDRGIYVAVMLFQGFSISRKNVRRESTPWDDHPFHKDNNILGIDGDTNGDGEGYEVHTLGDPAITKMQEAYVRKVVDTVGDLDNVIYEISNECHGESLQWHYHMVDLIQRYEKTKPKQHLIWISFLVDGMVGPGTLQNLLESRAEIISPSRDAVKKYDRLYQNDPPAADGSKVVITDTDHLWGIGGNQAWVWKSFLRGMHPIFMDPYRDSPRHQASDLDEQWEPIRRSMGYTLRFAERMNLVAMTPQDDLASSKYCLANPGEEYLVYLPEGGKVTVDLSAAKSVLSAEWFDPSSGETKKAKAVRGGTRRNFTAPFGSDAVLYLVRTTSKQ